MLDIPPLAARGGGRARRTFPPVHRGHRLLPACPRCRVERALQSGLARAPPHRGEQPPGALLDDRRTTQEHLALLRQTLSPEPLEGRRGWNRYLGAVRRDARSRRSAAAKLGRPRRHSRGGVSAVLEDARTPAGG